MSGVDERHSRRVVSGWETFPEHRGWLGGPPRALGVLKLPSQRVMSGREAFLESRGWLGGHSGVLGVVRRPSRALGVVGWLSWSAGSGRTALPECRQC